MTDVVANYKEETKPTGKITSLLISIIGFVLLGLAIKNIVIEFKTLNSINTLISLLLPFVLSILYIPITYLFSVYAKYNTIFIRISFKENDTKKIKRSHRLKILFKCRLSYKRLLWFEINGFKNMYVGMSSEKFDDLVKSIRPIKKGDKMKKNRRLWLLYLISSFILIMFGFIIGFYSGEKIYSYIITPFKNTSGNFDYSILWTAIAGIGTIFLGFVAISQNNKLHNLEKQNYKSINYSNLAPATFNISAVDKNKVEDNLLICNSDNSHYYYQLIISYKSIREINPSIWELYAINLNLSSTDQKLKCGKKTITDNFLYVDNRFLMRFYIGMNVEIIDLSNISTLFFVLKYKNDFLIHTSNDFGIFLKYTNQKDNTYKYICNKYMNSHTKIEY